MAENTQIAHLIDVGSTWTKGLAVSLTDGRILGRNQHPTTIAGGIMQGVNAVIAALGDHAGVVAFRAASSSAAGGLRVAAIGLVPDLTGMAARQASLGAGARVVFSGSYALNPEEIEGIRRERCDIILLTGGTDGGNSEVILQNAVRLAEARLPAAIVLAGNKSARAQARATLEAAGCDVRVADNVLPAIDVLSVDSAQAAIREVFLERIVIARGIEQLREWATDGMLPTPRAVLDASRFLADGQPALGTTVIVDIGGATTDVHSVGGEQVAADALLKGLPEPHVKRTVEGDLGLRVSAVAAADSLDVETLARQLGMESAQLRAEVSQRVETPELLREKDPIDRVMTIAAVAEALCRHAGRLDPIPLHKGTFFQTGKDLREAAVLIGSGGVFAARGDSIDLLSAAAAQSAMRDKLVPLAPKFLIDRDYVLFAVGLLAGKYPDVAAALARNSLR